jgi:hypothetical protein
MRWLGICERALGMMCRRALARQLAPGEALADKQIVQAWIAESRAHIDAARLMVLRTAWLIDQQGFAAAREEVSLIKFHVAAVLPRCSTGRSRSTARSASPTTPCSPSSTPASAAPASTTAPTRSTRWSSPAGSSTATPRGAS